MQIKTTTDLKAVRSMLFTTTADAAEFLGMARSEDLLNAENGKRHWMKASHVRTFEFLYSKFEETVRAMVNAKQAFIICYQNEGIYKDFEPEAFEALPLAAMHFRAALMAKFYIDNSSPTPVVLVTMNQKDFLAFLDGREDSQELRQQWAAEYVKKYRIFDDSADA